MILDRWSPVFWIFWPTHEMALLTTSCLAMIPPFWPRWHHFVHLSVIPIILTYPRPRWYHFVHLSVIPIILTYPRPRWHHFVHLSVIPIILNYHRPRWHHFVHLSVIPAFWPRWYHFVHLSVTPAFWPTLDLDGTTLYTCLSCYSDLPYT